MIVALPLTAVDDVNVPLICVDVTYGAQNALPHENDPFVIEHVVFTVVEPVP